MAMTSEFEPDWLWAVSDKRERAPRRSVQTERGDDLIGLILFGGSGWIEEAGVLEMVVGPGSEFEERVNEDGEGSEVEGRSIPDSAWST